MADTSTNQTIVSLSKQLLRPDHEIIAFRKKQPLSVLDLKKQVLLLSQQLSKSPEKYWALTMQDSFNFVVGLFALFYSGKHPKLISAYHQEIKDDYDALLTDNQAIHQYDTHKRLININQLFNANSVEIADFINKDFSYSTLTIFTSGSTGLPKPIEKTVNQFEIEIQQLESNWGKLSADLIVASVSHQHMYGLTFKIMLSLMMKIPFVCEPIIYQEQLYQYNDKKFLYITSPAIIKTLDVKLPTINCEKVISAGGSLKYEEALTCKQNFNVLPDEIYGSTETGIIATRKQLHPNMPWQLFSEMELQQNGDQKTCLISPLLTQPELLNDKITIVDAQHFHLNGRSDKIIKISENRVSLTYIENKINQLPEVEEAIVIPLIQNNRTILGAIVKLSTSHSELSKEHNSYNLTQYFRLFLKDELSLIELPKKWRFVENLPKNMQGKTTYMELKSLFETNEKVMNKVFANELSVDKDTHHVNIELVIPTDLFWFKGHFPSQPLLPGVVQLNWVIYYTQKYFNANLSLSSIDVIKFQCPILPQDRLKLNLKWNEKEQRIDFSYSFIKPDNTLKIASSGKLTLCQ